MVEGPGRRRRLGSGRGDRGWGRGGGRSGAQAVERARESVVGVGGGEGLVAGNGAAAVCAGAAEGAPGGRGLDLLRPATTGRAKDTQAEVRKGNTRTGIGACKRWKR